MLPKPPSSIAPSTSLGSADLITPVQLYSSGWDQAIRRLPKLSTNSTTHLHATPDCVSVSFQPTRLKTHGFVFTPSAADASVATPRSAATAARAGGPPSSPQGRSTRTRIKPPSDVIKLQDRLFYMLQPPLESILNSESLSFPCQPFPYQYEGIAFLYPRFAAILADEMGLGKTMQAITAVRLLLRAGEVRSVLLVCPKPLVTNWQREFALWAPEVPLDVISGQQHRRRWQWLETQVPVKVTNYELLVRDRELLENSSLHFDLMVLDEAQRIKNRSSTTSQVVRGIGRSRSWALTGTPIENSVEDLVGIFEFLSPGSLSAEMEPRRMAKKVGDYIIRRTKDKVLDDLPPKLFRDANVDLTPAQRTTYKMAEQQGVIELSELREGITIQHVFELVLRLKQICNFDPKTGESCKLERLAADLDEVAASGKKAIVFSQWVKTLQRLDQSLAHLRPLQYHGKVAMGRRDSVLREFKEDATRHVLLMSYGAGSVGLNLQFCEYVFLFDRWWNPAVEDQAINRAHRIGSAGPVTITRFLAIGTIEERIDEVLQHKRAIFDAVLSHAETGKSLGLTQHEIFGLFNLQQPPPSGSNAA
jgi:SNF2 family DNA or RNA helicase